ncbi:excitatory amino acid transporter 1-like isoform X2 [Biomphalaria glabrata]|uniref:Amino acid transporter n=1 Tax=Biomphalaria glabrata TaxID=6526 RepID=A0A9W2ZYP3_BIOGL|nr:excitatory amino acid transporter 1-like isoform X2 [Biomphalaria glabrata]
MERKRSSNADGRDGVGENNVNPVNTHVFITVPEEDLGFSGNLKKYGKKCIQGSKQNALLIGLLLSVVMGILLGLVIRSTKDKFSKREVMYLGFPGELLMRMLQMLILPIILSSLISGIAGLDGKTCGKMGLRTIGYFTVTTFMAVFLGILLAMTIQPGGNADRSSMRRYGKAEPLNSADTFLDLIRNVFPDNLIVTCFNAYRTKEVRVPIMSIPVVNLSATTTSTITTETMTTESPLATTLNETEEVQYDISLLNEGTGKPNVLGIVTFAILFGIMLGRMGERGKPILAFCDCLVEVTMKLFTFFLWYSPFGIAFLIAAKIVEMEDFSVLLGKVGMYFITVLIGLFIHGSIVLPLIYFVLVRKNPYTFIYGISQALATAFGTSSSSATMPVTLKCLEHNNHVDSRVASFVIPVGATINMDGTALYEAVAALFIAQVNNQSMNFGNIITISHCRFCGRCWSSPSWTRHHGDSFSGRGTSH